MTTNTLHDLIEELICIRDMVGKKAAKEVQVRIAVQPTWPLTHELDAITLEHKSEDKGRKGKVLWLAASHGHPYDEHPYAPKHAWTGGEVHPDEEEEERE